MKLLGTLLMVSGLLLVSVFGYQYWYSMQSMTEIDGNIVKASEETHAENRKVGLSSDTSNIRLDNPFKRGKLNKNDGSKAEKGGIATLVLPSIGIAYDVYWGTDEKVLAKGVGIYDSEWTTTPDMGGHTVLSGHRDSVFRPVGNLQQGEYMYVRYQGEDYEYKINDIWITDEDDRSVIVEKDEPTLTLTTCYPFTFIGSAPERYIIQGELVRKGDLLDL